MKERSIFDGLAPDAKISPELIEAWEHTMATLDEEIAHLMRCRAAYVKLIHAARSRIKSET